MTALAANTDARVGRMLDGLLRSTNRNARLKLTVTVERDGRPPLHQRIDVSKWTSRDGTTSRLYVQVPDTADWDNGIRPASPLVVDLATGEQREDARDPRVTPALAYCARAALRYARTGEPPVPSNGRVEVREESACGCCGLPLRDDTSIRLGIGPECERKYYGKATRRTRTVAAAVA